ncbi:MAG: WecB/TagA/CpsF family glycosyltransferase [Verrucomicrobia bacterium]|nr:WecB/TagA/CpsF family glycosyltransferase [Verrucomicrobiota bacterium]
MTKVNELVEIPEQTWEIHKEMDVHPMLAPVSCKEKQIDRNAFAKVAMYGVPFTMINFDEWKRDVLDSVERRSNTIYFTANIDFIVQSLGDHELRRILCQADRVLCDGTPVRWLSGCFGERLVERLAGSDLVPEILNIADLNGYRVLYGGRKRLIEERLRTSGISIPGLGGLKDLPPHGPLLSRCLIRK